MIIIDEDQNFDYEQSSVITQWQQYCVCLLVIPVTLAVRQHLTHTAHETAICPNPPIYILQETEKKTDRSSRDQHVKRGYVFREYKYKPFFFVDTAF